MHTKSRKITSFWPQNLTISLRQTVHRLGHDSGHIFFTWPQWCLFLDVLDIPDIQGGGRGKDGNGEDRGAVREGGDGRVPPSGFWKGILRKGKFWGGRGTGEGGKRGGREGGSGRIRKGIFWREGERERGGKGKGKAWGCNYTVVDMTFWPFVHGSPILTSFRNLILDQFSRLKIAEGLVFKNAKIYSPDGLDRYLTSSKESEMSAEPRRGDRFGPFPCLDHFVFWILVLKQDLGIHFGTRGGGTEGGELDVLSRPY